MKTVFLTGATGTMGWAGLHELLTRSDRFKVTILVRPSKKNKKKLKKYLNNTNLKIVWGDLMNYNDVLEGVTGADYVLHVGGMVSPEADKYPEKTMKVNVTAAKNVVSAVKAQPNADEIKVVYIGSVAQTGFRDYDHIFGRTGDPLIPAKYDNYAVSKIIAECIFVDSGLKRWVSLRQSGILYPKLVTKGLNPITFHVPLRSGLEWATVEDSGRLLANVCENFVPDEFWNRFYNISSGASYRLTNYEFEVKLLKAIYCPPPEKLFDTNWFALKNFHGFWYTDADVLEKYLHFRRNVSCDDYFKYIRTQIPWYFRLAKIVSPILMKVFMKTIASNKETGTLGWIKTRNKEKIETYFGSLDAWQNIPSWHDLDRSHPSEKYTCLDHGYDESKPLSEITIEDLRAVASFRNGKLLSDYFTPGDVTTVLQWETDDGKQFSASPVLVLLGGYFGTW